MILLVYFLLNMFHVGHITEFKYTIDGKRVYLECRIERDEVYAFDLKTCYANQISDQCIFNYVSSHASIIINGEELEMIYQSSKSIGDIEVIQFISIENVSSLDEIVVCNNSFYEFDPNHRNRIILDLEQIQKSYLLNINQFEIIAKK